MIFYLFILSFKFLSVVARRCTQPTIINGIDIPLDLSIVVDVLSIHYDNELWGPVDTKTFYPLRLVDNKVKMNE